MHFILNFKNKLMIHFLKYYTFILLGFFYFHYFTTNGMEPTIESLRLETTSEITESSC